MYRSVLKNMSREVYIWLYWQLYYHECTHIVKEVYSNRQIYYCNVWVSPFGLETELSDKDFIVFCWGTRRRDCNRGPSISGKRRCF